MTTLLPTTICSAMFEYSKPNPDRSVLGHKGGLFVAEMSTVTTGKIPQDVFQQDGSFFMRSEKTGDVIRFVYVDRLVSRDSDRETEGWVYIVDARAIAKNLALADIHVHILND